MSPFKEIDNYNIPNVSTLTDEDIFGKLITDDKLLSEYQMTYFKGSVKRYTVHTI